MQPKYTYKNTKTGRLIFTNEKLDDPEYTLLRSSINLFNLNIKKDKVLKK